MRRVNRRLSAEPGVVSVAYMQGGEGLVWDWRSGFAALGLALAAIGIYCVISYNVTQRVHEIGMRMALGASRGDIINWVLREAGKVAGIGLFIELFSSIALEKLVRVSVFTTAQGGSDSPSASSIGA